MIIKMPDSRGQERRENLIRTAFVADGVLPVFGTSCEDGVILVGASRRPDVEKVKRLLDRVVFAGAGNMVDFGQIYNSMSAHARVRAHVYLSPGDVVRIVEEVKDLVSAAIRERFRDFYSNSFYECELLIACLGFEKGTDEMFGIGFNGSVRSSRSYMRIPGFGKVGDQNAETEGDDSAANGEDKIGFQESQYIAESLSPDLDMKEALRRIIGGVNEFRKERIFWEVIILSREEARARRFEYVYKRLSPEEIKNWLLPS